MSSRTSAAAAQSSESILSTLEHAVRETLIHNPPAVNVEPAEERSPLADWDKLLSRLMNLTQHLKLADQRLYDFQSIPPDIEPAAVVVHDAVVALDVLRDEFDEWHATHVHAPKHSLAEGEAGDCRADAVNLEALLDRIDRGEATIDELAAAGEALDLPPWVLAAVRGLPRENIEHRMRHIRGLVEGYVTGRGAPAGPANAAAPVPGQAGEDDRVESGIHPNDRADACIRTYLASVQPIDGVIFDGNAPVNRGGRSIIESLALSAEGTDKAPRLRLSADEVADVLAFIHCSEPVDRETWWTFPEGGPSQIEGFTLVLEALEQSLRTLGSASVSTGSEAPVTVIGRTPAQKTLARLMHRLDVLTDKLTLAAACPRWSDPGQIDGDDLGAVAIVRESSNELCELYCHLGEWAHGPGGIERGPWVDSFDEGADLESRHGKAAALLS
jgi:hypothetical protein